MWLISSGEPARRVATLCVPARGTIALKFRPEASLVNWTVVVWTAGAAEAAAAKKATAKAAMDCILIGGGDLFVIDI